MFSLGLEATIILLRYAWWQVLGHLEELVVAATIVTLALFLRTLWR